MSPSESEAGMIRGPQIIRYQYTIIKSVYTDLTAPGCGAVLRVIRVSDYNPFRRHLHSADSHKSSEAAGDLLFRTGGAAQAALNAGILREAQHRLLRAVRQSAGGTGGDARQAQRAALGVDDDLAERRVRRQRYDIGPGRRDGVLFL